MKNIKLSIIAGAIALSAVCSCQQEEKSAPAPTDFKMNEATLTINVGDTKELDYTVSPSNAKISSLHWMSSDSNVATANAGFVTGIKEGTATIIIANAETKEEWTICDSVKVTVSAIAVDKIELNRATVEMFKGKTKWETIKAYVMPFNASDRTLSWTSSDPSSIKFVTLDDKKTKIEKELEETTSKTGDEVYFIGYTPGDYTITAASANGKKATAKVTILNIDDIDMWADDNAGSCDIIAGDEGDIKSNFLSYSKATGKVSWTKNETGSIRSDELKFKNGSKIVVTQFSIEDLKDTWNFTSKTFAPNNKVGVTAGNKTTVKVIFGEPLKGETLKDIDGTDVTNNIGIKGLFMDAVMDAAIIIDYENKVGKLGLFFDGRTAQKVNTGKEDYPYVVFLPELGGAFVGGPYNFCPVPVTPTANYAWGWITFKDIENILYNTDNKMQIAGKYMIGISCCTCKSATPSNSDFASVNAANGYDVIYQANINTDVKQGMVFSK